MPDEETLEAFTEWLLADYAPASVRKMRVDVATMAAWGPSPPAAKRLGLRLQDYRWAWGRWDAFCAELDVKNRLPEPTALERRPGRRNGRGGRLKPAMSIPEDAWRELRARVQKDKTAPGAVLDVLTSTGKRISDVLRINERALRGAFGREDGQAVIEVKGGKPVILSILGARRAWERLYGFLAPDQSVADAISAGGDHEAGGAAYQQVRRALKKHARAVGLQPNDVHLHRTRRTIAVMLIRKGATLEEVQRVCDHGSRSTTEKYVDEAMSDMATRALNRLNR